MSKSIAKNLLPELTDSVAQSNTQVTQTDRELDWALVQRVQSGEVAAFDRLVHKYRVSLFSIIYNMTGNRADASDITQEVFIKAFQSIKRFRGKAAFFTWLYRIAVNTSITFIKKSKRQRFIHYESIDETMVSGGNS